MADFGTIRVHREISGTVADDEIAINFDAISYVKFHTVNVGPAENGQTKTTAAVYFMGDPNDSLKIDDAKEISALRAALDKRRSD